MVRYGLGRPDKTAFTTNISKTGAFLRTNQVLKPGTTIQVEFVFPDQPFSLWAQVMWSKKVPAQMAHILLCGMGVRFINPGPEWEVFFAAWESSKKL
jgi:hypothetical protein